MGVRIFVLLSVLLVSFISSFGLEVTFMKKYVLTNDGVATSPSPTTLLETQDGKLFVVVQANQTVYVAKMDKEGNILWQRTLDDDNFMEDPFYAMKTSDGNYLLLGRLTWPDGNFIGGRASWIVKMNQQGDIVWQKAYDEAGFDGVFSAVEDNNGNYIVVGRVVDNNNNSDLLVMKVSKNDGSIIWQKRYGGQNDEASEENLHTVGAKIIRTSDGKYLIITRTKSFSTDSWGDIWVLKIDNNGDLIWNKVYGGESEDIPTDVIELNDGYVIVGITKSFGGTGNPPTTYGTDIWIFKVNKTDGSIIWQKVIVDKFDTNDTSRNQPYRVLQTDDGNLLIVGWTENMGRGNDVFVVKIDNSGNILMQKAYNMGGIERVAGNNTVIKASEGDYIIAVKGENSYYLMKISETPTVPVCYYGMETNALIGDTNATVNNPQPNQGTPQLQELPINIPSRWAGSRVNGLKIQEMCPAIKIDPKPQGGSVFSNDNKINCGTSGNDCEEVYYRSGIFITLNAQADSNYQFLNWGGDCSGCGNNTQCNVSIDRWVDCGNSESCNISGEAVYVCSANFNALPVIDSFIVTPTSGNVPLEVTLACVGSDADGQVVEYRFDVNGDGTVDITNNTGNAQYTYQEAGQYSVTCTVVDDRGATTSSDPITVTVNAPQSGNGGGAGTGGDNQEQGDNQGGSQQEETPQNEEVYQEEEEGVVGNVGCNFNPDGGSFSLMLLLLLPMAVWVRRILPSRPS